MLPWQLFGSILLLHIRPVKASAHAKSFIIWLTGLSFIRHSRLKHPAQLHFVVLIKIFDVILIQ